jgi:hypothetical protein
VQLLELLGAAGAGASWRALETSRVRAGWRASWARWRARAAHSSEEGPGDGAAAGAAWSCWSWSELEGPRDLSSPCRLAGELGEVVRARSAQLGGGPSGRWSWSEVDLEGPRARRVHGGWRASWRGGASARGAPAAVPDVSCAAVAGRRAPSRRRRRGGRAALRARRWSAERAWGAARSGGVRARAVLHTRGSVSRTAEQRHASAVPEHGAGYARARTVRGRGHVRARDDGPYGRVHLPPASHREFSRRPQGSLSAWLRAPRMASRSWSAYPSARAGAGRGRVSARAPRRLVPAAPRPGSGDQQPQARAGGRGRPGRRQRRAG